jgi:CO/xanthine dehydrogenase FAD-binding subunit
MLQSVATPASLREVAAALAEAEGARIIAGGTIVMPEVNYGAHEFTRLVSLRKAELSGISVDGGSATIGAATTLSEVDDAEELAFLRPALDSIASPTIRNMATVGGNLFAPQPYGDFAVCLVALGASATIAGPGGERSASVEELATAGIGPDEIVTSVAFPLPKADTFKFRKAGRKALNTGAVVTVAASVIVEGGSILECRIALGGVARHVVRALSVENALRGKQLDRPSVEAAAGEALNDMDPFDDAYASAWYRRRVTPVHIRRALIGE